jgi:hypothetical protein
MFFKMNEGVTQLYYLRAIGWDKTVLIGTQEIQKQFEVINYHLDPPLERLNELETRGRRLI